MRVYNRTRGIHLADKARIADSFWKRLRGLLGGPAPQMGEGLLITPCNGIHTCFMDYPIDVLFLDKEGRVLKAMVGLPPYRVSPVVKGAAMVLELPPGTVRLTGTWNGDHLVFSPWM